MSSYISSDFSAPSPAGIPDSQPAAVATPAPQPRAVQADTVHLSEKAQALQLSHQGEGVSQIKSALGITTAEVDSDLGETVATVAAAAPSGGGGHAAAPAKQAGSDASTAPAASTTPAPSAAKAPAK
jgi:hypothetical protein